MSPQRRFRLLLPFRQAAENNLGESNEQDNQRCSVYQGTQPEIDRIRRQICPQICILWRSEFARVRSICRLAVGNPFLPLVLFAFQFRSRRKFFRFQVIQIRLNLNRLVADVGIFVSL